jgi:opacity protein-like surface antigen
MERRLVCALAVLFAVLGSIAADASQAGAGLIEVSGTGGRGRLQAYDMHLHYSLDSDISLGDAILVYAEPSHVLLVQHSFHDGGPGSFGQAGALAHGSGNGARFGYDLLLPYNPQILGDSAITVTLRAKGRDWLIAAGRIDAMAFSIATRFDVVYAADGSIEAITSVEHCCGGGGRCGRMCVTCDGAYFTCDRINCTIECGWL